MLWQDIALEKPTPTILNDLGKMMADEPVGVATIRKAAAALGRSVRLLLAI